MAFGFDPSIILANLPKAPQESSLNDTLQTLSQLATQRTQQQQSQATLADLLRRQGQEKSLSSIYSANADAPEGLATALMRGGFGGQAFAAQDQAAQMRGQEALRTKQLQEVQDAHRKKVGETFFGVDNQAKWDAARQEIASSPDPMIAAYAAHIPEKFEPGAAERLGNLAMSAKDRSDVQQKQLDRETRTTDARIMASSRPQILVQGPGGEQFFADPRKPAAPATPVLDADGKPIVKPPSSQTGVRKDALIGKLSENMTHALDEGQWKGPIAAQVTSKNQAEHLLALTENAKGGGFNNLDSREQEELAIGFAKLLSGGQGSEATVKSLVPPNTLQAGAQGIKEWLLNEPQGRNQLAFVERLAHSVERQKAVAQKLIDAEKAKRAGSYRKLQELDPEQHQAVLEGAGLDPNGFDEHGVYRPATAAGSAKGGGLTKAEADELKALEARFGGGK